MAGRTTRIDALILAGGRSSRMNGAAKPTAVVDGVTLVDRVVDAAGFCDTVVVVGPPGTSTRPHVRHAREDPPFGGPVAALEAGLAAVHSLSPEHDDPEHDDPGHDDPGHDDPEHDDDVVLTLSADLPFVVDLDLMSIVEFLVRTPHLDVVFATDQDGRRQYLVGAWRRGALRRALAAALVPSPGGGRGPSIRDLLPTDHARVETISLVGIEDVDTPEDLAAVRAASVRPSVDRARFLISRRIPRVAPAVTALADALGGTLAEPLRAARPFPAFVTSAMDGYAVVGDGPWHLDDTVVAAGSTASVSVEPGHAVRIATGAAVPGGAAVVRDEFVTIDGSRLVRSAGSPIRDDARRIAEDWDVGAELAAPGTLVTPALVSAALSAGVVRASTRRAPTVRVVVTGDELQDGGQAPGYGRISDTIGPVLPSYLHWSGLSVTEIRRCADTDAAFDAAIGGHTDVVVVVGATGRGAADPLASALERSGGVRVVDGVACRPGGSASVTVTPDGRVVLGVPGNPYAAVATVCLLAPAIAAAATGRPAAPPLSGTVSGDVDPDDITRVLPATRVGGDEWECAPSVRTAHLAALIGRDALAIVTPQWRPGDRVEIVPLPRR